MMLPVLVRPLEPPVAVGQIPGLPAPLPEPLEWRQVRLPEPPLEDPRLA